MEDPQKTAIKALFIGLVPLALLIIGVNHWFPRTIVVLWMTLSAIVFGMAAESHSSKKEN